MCWKYSFLHKFEVVFHCLLTSNILAKISLAVLIPVWQWKRLKRPRFDPWVEKIPGWRKWQPTRNPWTEKPGGLQSMGSHRVVQDWRKLAPEAFRIFSFFLVSWYFVITCLDRGLLNLNFGSLCGFFQFINSWFCYLGNTWIFSLVNSSPIFYSVLSITPVIQKSEYLAKSFNSHIFSPFQYTVFIFFFIEDFSVIFKSLLMLSYNCLPSYF